MHQLQSRPRRHTAGNAASQGPAGSQSTRAPRTGRMVPGSLVRRLTSLERENADLRRQLDERRDLWELAHRDALTGLWNRRHADQRLQEELSQARRHPRHGFSVIAVDLDNLKTINDQLGHKAGDAALQWAAHFLTESVRAHDICCRAGGDEFIIILPDTSAPECESLLARLREGHASFGGFRVGISAGAASFPLAGNTALSLLHLADTAMYADKRRRKAAHPDRHEGDACAGMA